VDGGFDDGRGGLVAVARVAGVSTAESLLCVRDDEDDDDDADDDDDVDDVELVAPLESDITSNYIYICKNSIQTHTKSTNSSKIPVEC